MFWQSYVLVFTQFFAEFGGFLNTAWPLWLLTRGNISIQLTKDHDSTIVQ